jgi:FkbH-like protein
MASNYMERILSARLGALTGTERLAYAAEVLGHLGDSAQPEATELLAAGLRGTAPDLLGPWLAGLPETRNTAWLRAQLARNPADALDAWERFFTLTASRDPVHLLAWARALAAAERYEEATARLRIALSQPVRYPFFPRAEKLVAQLAARTESFSRECRIAILSSGTTTVLAPVISALCLRDGIRAEIYQGLYGAIEQEVLSDESGLAKFRPDIVLVLVNWRDLQLPALGSDEDTVAENVVRERTELCRRLAENFGCHVVHSAYDFPADESAGYLAGAVRGGRTRVIESINLRLREQVARGISILDTPGVQRETGTRRWEDEAGWARYKQHPATDALPELAEAFLSHVRAVLGLTRKVLVTDLDNTLWNGVIGEDGLNGIGIGPGTPAGEAHQRLQEYMMDLKKRGILLAVCSKNNPEDARLPFEQHQHMVLRLDDFAAFRANWDDKVTNLRALAKDLSLGLDSFVFLDDNPLEREWIRSQLPQVAVVELGPAVFHYVRDLDRGKYFQMLALSAEDLARAEQYRVEAQRESLRTTTASLDDFLMQLQLQASVEPVTDKNLTRVTQLVNKTNQFNVTTRRYTEAQVRAIAEDAAGWAGAFHMSDRMGSYGLIGVLFCTPGASAGEWEIDTWLMSCRTLGRQMEKFMFDRMVEAAISRGIRRLIGVFRPTGKNGLVRELYDQTGFERVSEQNGEVHYRLDVPAAPVITATHVRNLTIQAGHQISDTSAIAAV